MLKAFAAVVLSVFTLTGAIACDETMPVAHSEEAGTTVAMAAPAVEFMGDGIAAESAARSAHVEQVFTTAAVQALAGFEADLIVMEVMEPVATGTLALKSWEEEEPRLLEAYLTAREAYEATHTP
jgi:CheY-like chemotaxis protein